MYKPLNEISLVEKYFRIFCVVCAYWVVSIFTVFVNKALFSSKDIDLNAPIFVTWYQCIISSIICFLMSQLAKLFPSCIYFPEGNVLHWATFKKVVPLSLLFAAMITTNNLCLKYVSVAFYYIGRSLTTVFNVVFTYLLLRQKTSLKCILCCGIIISGFWLGLDQESLTESFSWGGTVFGVLGSLTLSLYTIYTKKILPLINDEIWLLSYYNNVYSSVLLIPLIIVNGEVGNIMNCKNLTEMWFWAMMTVGGLCGFSIGFVAALQIKVTSPLTHNISGTAKACAQTVIATQWYQDTKSFLWWLSNIIVLLGSAFYARTKQVEMELNHNSDRIPQKI